MSIYYYVLPGREVKNLNVPIYKWTLVNIIYILPLFYFSMLMQVVILRLVSCVHYN